MKILKPGRPQKGWSSEQSCTGKGNGGGGCGAVLLVEQNDVFRTESYARDETYSHNTFKCCACGVWTDIPHVPFTPRAEAPGDRVAPS